MGGFSVSNSFDRGHPPPSLRLGGVWPTPEGGHKLDKYYEKERNRTLYGHRWQEASHRVRIVMVLLPLLNCSCELLTNLPNGYLTADQVAIASRYPGANSLLDGWMAKTCQKLFIACTQVGRAFVSCRKTSRAFAFSLWHCHFKNTLKSPEA